MTGFRIARESGGAPEVPATVAYPTAGDSIPSAGFAIDSGGYRIRFARSATDLDQVLALRYRIFNLELGEGLDESHRTGRDEDELDARMHHLMILAGEEVVGTYRMQTAEMAAQGGGFYAAAEFQLDSLPAEVIGEAVEIGRACVAKEHRSGRVLNLLWRGLAEYLTWNRKHYLFGCCSLTSQDPALAEVVHDHLEATGRLHQTLAVQPHPHCRCHPPSSSTLPRPSAHIPALFQSYLGLGAKVLGAPAIDRQFKTIDWLVILDVREIDPAIARRFFR
jgi:putative hemolysin